MKHNEFDTVQKANGGNVQAEEVEIKWFKWRYLAILVGVLLVLVYLGITAFYMSHFYKGTVINYVNCSNMTVDEAEAAIKKQAEKYQLTLHGRDDITEQIKGSDFDLKYVLEGNIKDVMKNQNAFLWPYCMFNDSERSLPSSVTYNGRKFEDLINGLACMQEKNMKKPRNARISRYSKKEKKYRIIPEDKGTIVIRDKLVVKCKEAIQELNPNLVLEDEDCYKKVAITSEDKSLNTALEKMNRYVGTKIRYQFGDKEEILDGDIIYRFIKKTKTNKISLREDAVKEYIRDLARKYDTFGKKRKFKTSYKKTITISGGDYGWWMNQSKEFEQLKPLIEKGKKRKRTPTYHQKAVEYSKKDYGNTYVEINLKRQRLFYYKKGKKVLESDFVSGNPYKGNASPTGLFGVMYKQHHAILRGADYNTPVEFWMPFAGNVGMHDATWRNKFGGNIYRGAGSHGCINMPYEKAKKLFGYIEARTPVICYKL